MKTSLLCGKGGVGKTTSATALALMLADRGEKTAIVDYDGGHSVKNALGIARDLTPNAIHAVAPNLAVSIIDNVPFTSILNTSGRGPSRLKKYLGQFEGDFGILPWGDMLNVFFGAPTDIALLQKFMGLVSILCQLKDEGYTHVVIDVEPTAGLERLLSGADAMARSLRNLQKQGKLLLTVVGAKWPDIRGYLESDYIQKADQYMDRMSGVVKQIRGAQYILVCIPEASPVQQTFEVREIIERFGGKAQACIVNNVRDEGYEHANIARLNDHSLPIIKISRRDELHGEGKDRQRVLLEVGASIVSRL